MNSLLLTIEHMLKLSRDKLMTLNTLAAIYMLGSIIMYLWINYSSSKDAEISRTEKQLNFIFIAIYWPAFLISAIREK